MWEVYVLKAGYAKWQGPGQQRASGTIALAKGPKNVVVDTGLPQDRALILSALESYGLRPDDIHYVVCTHGHSDHIGNNNLFPDAMFVVSYDVSRGDTYSFHPFAEGTPYRIDEGAEVVATPGHTSEDISALFRTQKGVVAVVGDLFESVDDLTNDALWQAFSKFPDIQRRNRWKILRMADYIVPGHGSMFHVEESIKALAQKEGG